MKRIVPVAVLFVLVGLMPCAAADRGTVLVRQTFGTWQVLCTEDTMTAARGCALGSDSYGPGPFGPTTLRIGVYSAHQRSSSVAFIEPTMGWRVTRILTRFDADDTQSISCDQFAANSCIFNGPARKMLTTGLEYSRGLRVRLTILNGNAYDFNFELAGYRAAERAFIAAQTQYLP